MKKYMYTGTVEQLKDNGFVIESLGNTTMFALRGDEYSDTCLFINLDKAGLFEVNKITLNDNNSKQNLKTQIKDLIEKGLVKVV